MFFFFENWSYFHNVFKMNVNHSLLVQPFKLSWSFMTHSTTNKWFVGGIKNGNTI